MGVAAWKNKFTVYRAYHERAVQPSSKRTYNTWMVLLKQKLILEQQN
jgi:hypothetical protein